MSSPPPKRGSPPRRAAPADAPAQPVELRPPASLAEVAGMRSALRSWLQALGVVTDTVDRALVVLSELATNAIEASPDGSSIVVRWHAEGRALQITVEDRGPGFAYAAAEPVDETAERGRGLVIVDGLAESISVAHADGRTTVSARVNLDR